MSDPQHYRSPLEGRYASPQMRAIWSDQRKFTTWRRLWLALAEAQQELGLGINDGQLAELRAHLDDIDFERAAEYEQKLRHDVMAHVHALGEVAPNARPIIHLGATSQFVNDNTELLQIRESLELIGAKIAAVIIALADFAGEHRGVPALGFTHGQPAQPTTVGKRAAMWAQEFALALEDVEHRLDTLRFRGVKGTTGTQASFLALFDGVEEKVEKLDELVTEKMDWPVNRRFAVSGQTYPRVVDAQVVNALAVTAAAVHKCATDIRLLSSRRELEEPFESTQVGSSAMAYKRNPMRCERACSLARFVINLAANPLHTAATQWLERSLDDSANRRLVLPEAFLGLDAVLEIMRNVAGGLIVNRRVIEHNLKHELPFFATENILMAAVKAGADRQQAHELIRRHSHDAAARMKEDGVENDLLERLASEPVFSGLDFEDALDPARYVGRAASQVERFLDEIVTPIRARYGSKETSAAELRV